MTVQAMLKKLAQPGILMHKVHDKKKEEKKEERDIAMLIDHTKSPCRGKNT